ncbi:MAG: MFS transporter [Candidatus Sumerlaeia bacterium]|nr:MFS transporter [Candidatus Sumerlaeia bacterium]
MKPLAPNSAPPSPFHSIFRALRYRNYRLFFIGQGISLVGTWMQAVAMSWLVYRLTGSALLLGVVGFASHIPTFLFSPIAGVLADRWDRRRMLIAAQAAAMGQALVLAALVFSGWIAAWQIIALGVVVGVVTAFDIPTRQSFVAEMVERKEDLGNAIALNSFLFNSARILGPSIGGILIAAVGEGVCFLLNGLSYLGVIVALSAMRLERKSARQRRHVLTELKEGFAYAYRFPPVRSLLLLLGAMTLLAAPYSTLLPVFAKDVLQGGSHAQGFLMAAAGCGALAGAVFLASRRSVAGLGRVIVSGMMLIGIGQVVFSQSRVLPLSLLAMVAAGFGMMVMMASCNTILQTLVDDDKRGRVMSLYTMAFMGAGPTGSLLAGFLAAHAGAPATVLTGGLGCLGAMGISLRYLPAMRKIVGPIYAAMNVAPEVKEG